MNFESSVFRKGAVKSLKFKISYLYVKSSWTLILYKVWWSDEHFHRGFSKKVDIGPVYFFSGHPLFSETKSFKDNIFLIGNSGLQEIDLSLKEMQEELENAFTNQSSISPTTIFSQHNEDQTFKSLKVDDEKSKARQVLSEPFNKGIIQ